MKNDSARAFRIEGYAIVSADGNIADRDGAMPPELHSDADQAYLAAALDSADLLVHGARSHEGQARSGERRRLIMTRKSGAKPDAAAPNARPWNPGEASLAEACAAFGLGAGRLAVLGGPEVYRYFLDFGYDAFHLSRMGALVIPGGLPVFARRSPAESAETLLARHGLTPDAAKVLDAARDVTLTVWRRRP
jgi:dihydrofolate reductase